MNSTTIIGAGLAGCEAAWQIAKRGGHVTLYEMRPSVMTKAHTCGDFAELVCSNSLGSSDITIASGLLKEELKKLGSLLIEAANHAKVPAGQALAVNRKIFSEYIENKIKNHPNITIVSEETTSIPAFDAKNPLIIASGPLTSKALSDAIIKLLGENSFAFYDAISPIVTYDSIDHNVAFLQSRYDKGDSKDYLNIPLNKEEYLDFINQVRDAEKFVPHSDADNDAELKPFEGCMPIEDIIARGEDALRFGPFKPVGLQDPRDGKTPYAVMQLRQEDSSGSLWNLVGMQTKMKHGEQTRIFRSLPGMQNVEFVRLGTVHRNSFINSPKHLAETLQSKNLPGLFFAGQITGSEGYVESIAGGLLAGINAYNSINENELISFPKTTAIGALFGYISNPEIINFQPMNINFGIIENYVEQPVINGKKRKIKKKDKRIIVAEAAMKKIEELLG